jgi:iron complex outermembrane receptor protein
MADGVPMGGALQPTTQLRSLVGGAPTLLPEEGENYTIGLVYTPSYLDGFSLALDFWSIELTDVIVTLGASTVLNRCYLDGAQQDAAFCDLITRKGDGSVETVRTTSTNAAVNTVEGVDLGAIYSMDTDGLGNFRFSFDATYYTKDEYAQSATSTPSESFGWYDGAADFRWRANATVDWMYDAWSVTWNMRFLDDMKDDCWIAVFYIPDAPCSNPNQPNNFGYDGVEEMEQTTYHDVQVSYEINENMNVFVGGRNIFGTEPPKTFDSFSHGFDMAWDMPEGGYFYGGFNYRM